MENKNILNEKERITMREFIIENSEPIPFIGCWIYLGSINADGYGRRRWHGRKIMAHRLSYFGFVGKTIPKGKEIMHTCDIRCCVNPAHLKLCTHLENIKDRDIKQRMMRGERSPFAKLKEKDVRAIRKAWANGATGPKLAAQYGVDRATIWNAAHGKIWKHIEGAIA